MSLRYTGAWMQDGAFNPLTAPTPTTVYGLLSWGYNNNGQLGLGNRTNYSSPKQIGGFTNWSSISCGAYHSLAIKSDGTLWAWGQNDSGQLGLGNRTNYSSPKQVGSLTNWLAISGGYLHSVAIKTDGTLWAWGINNRGQLGFGNTTSYSSPKQVGSLTTWKTLASLNSSYCTMAIKTDGTLWSWGYNGTGLLGLGNTTYYSSPKQVGALTNWLMVSASYSAVAIKTNGTLWSWGWNYGGQLGIGNSTDYSSPKQIGALTTWATCSKETYSDAAIKTDGSLWTWGAGANGQLGNGGASNYSSPIHIGALTNWSKIYGLPIGSYAAVKTDGTLWAWGANNQGQLGLGTIGTYYSPNQVGALTNWSKVATGISLVLAIT